MRKGFKKFAAVVMCLTVTLMPVSDVWGLVESNDLHEEMITRELLDMSSGEETDSDELIEEIREDGIGEAQEEINVPEAEDIIESVDMISEGEGETEESESPENTEIYTPDGSAAYGNPRRNSDGSVTYDCVWFGNYWQDDTDGNGTANTNDSKTPVKWRVLSATNDDLFLLADRILDAKAYDTSNTSITWEKSTIRSWLNGYGASYNNYGTDYTSYNFIDKAFTSAEKNAIKNTFVDNSISQGKYNTDGGNDTYDKLFFLSFRESITEGYGFSTSWNDFDKARRAKTSAFAKARGASTSTSSEYEGNGDWWLRSPGLVSYFAAYVSSYGHTEYYGLSTYMTNSARPALHISPSSSLISPAGTVCSDGTVNEKAPTGGNIENRCTVSFDSNGGSSVSPKTVAYGKTIKKPSNPKKEGYTFTGWYKEEACINAWNFSKDKVTGNIILYAGWSFKGSSKTSGTKKLRYWNDDTKVEETASINWNGKLFSKDAAEYDKDLALLSSVICANTNTSLTATHEEMERLRNNLGELGFEAGNIAIDNYYHENIDDLGMIDLGEGDKFACVFASQPMNINGELTNVILVSARGTTTDDEKIGDAFSDNRKYTEFEGYYIYDHVYLFQEILFQGLNKYLSSNELTLTNGNKIKLDDYIDNKSTGKLNIKFLVTGHSLGGAAANLLGERLTRRSKQDGAAWWSDVTDPKDIYVYTYGGLNSIAENSINSKPVTEGYENIHNIYNFYDSFGPKGGVTSIATNWLGIYHIGSAHGKFGHLDMFEKTYGEFLSNHQIWNYIKAVQSNAVDPKFQYNSSIWKQEHIYACPIDIEVYKGNSLIARITDNVVDKKATIIPAYVENDRKHILLKGAADYKVKIIGNNSGTMNALIEDYNPDNSSKILTDIAIYNNKVFEVPVSGAVDATDINMYVLDQNENISKTVQTNGTEEEIKNVYIVNQKVKLDSLFGNVYDGFKISSKSFASINKNIMKPKKAGVITVYAMRKSGKTMHAEEKINLIFEKPAFNEKTISFTRYGETLSLVDNLKNTHKLPDQWISSNEKIASVNDGVLTVNGKGSAKITAVYGEGKNAAKYSFNVKCNIPVISKKSVNMLTGGKIKLKLNNTKKIPYWWTNHSSIVSVDGDGVVTALNAGSASVSAVVDNVSYSCVVIVKPPKISKSRLTLKVNKTAAISLTNTKIGKKDVKWQTSDNNVARVDEYGKITAIGEGEAVIYTDAGGVRNECVVTVKLR